VEKMKSLTSKRYILADETPCQFCDMAIRRCCPYEGLTDDVKGRLCRVYLYFLALKEYEKGRFEGEHEHETVKLCECVYDISLMAQHMIEEHNIEAEDSRELFSSILEWARAFEAGFTKEEDAAGDYMERIEAFAEEMLRYTYGVK